MKCTHVSVVSFNSAIPRTSLLLLSTDAMLVCVLTDIKPAEIIFIFLCPPSGYRYLCDAVTPTGVKVCTTIDLSSEHKVSPFGGDIFTGHQMRDQKRERRSVFWASKAA